MSLNPHIVAGILLVAAALVIGILASVTGIRNCRGPRERSFVRRSCWVIWSSLTVFMTLMYFLPSPWRFVMLGPYFTYLPWRIYVMARQHQVIRRLEEFEAVSDTELT